LIKSLKNLWARVRQLSGDDAYERYLQHYAEHHQSSSEDEAEPPLSKEAFLKSGRIKNGRALKDAVKCC